MRPECVDWHSGEVLFWDLDFLDPLKPLMDQLDDLKEDLAQVRYRGGVIVDVGWFPELSCDGGFVVSVVRESDWDQPLFREDHRSVDGLVACLREAVHLACTIGAVGKA